MSDLTRRQFLETSAKIAALLGLNAAQIPRVAEALEILSAGNPPVVWLQAQSCSGCSVSLLNSENPGPAAILTRHISLLFHATLSAATGHVGMEVLTRSIRQGGFLLVVEGSIPQNMPEACTMGHKPIADLIAQAARSARAAIALGTCAAFGGIPAAENNPTGAIGLEEFLTSAGIQTPLINLPGCPTHPDWLVGTLVHALKFGIPDLDERARPKVFYGRLIHDQCPRFPDYERENFARTFSDEGCLFKLGCLGTNTHADCATRSWNGGVNSCILAGAPCIGCASEAFARKADFPFYRKNEKQTQKGE